MLVVSQFMLDRVPISDRIPLSKSNRIWSERFPVPKECRQTFLNLASVWSERFPVPKACRQTCLNLASVAKYLTCIFKMPKAPSALYNHNTHDATARQLNISGGGRNFATYTTSNVPIASVPPEAHSENEHYPDPMDIDDDNPTYDDDLNEESETVEVMPGVHVKPKPKAKRYENSVSAFRTCFISKAELHNC